MSNTKGFEVKLRGCSIQMSERQLYVIDVNIRKEGDLFSVSAGGLMNDKKTFCTLCCVHGLSEGDEITIERKNFEHSSPSVAMPDPLDGEPMKIAYNKSRLELFHDLEAYLKEKGLIE